MSELVQPEAGLLELSNISPEVLAACLTSLSFQEFHFELESGEDIRAQMKNTLTGQL